MNIAYHERMQRGTAEFPLEIYQIEPTHPKYKMQLHWHKEFEIIRVTRGVLRLRLNEKELTLRQNESVFVPGGIIHSGAPEDCVYECLVFSPSVLYNLQTCRRLVKTYMQKIAVYGENGDISAAFEGMKHRNRGFELEVIGALYRIAADIVKKDEGYAVPPNERMEKIKPAMLMIEENYAGKITLEELAKVCRLSPNYFSRYFKEVVGQTPFEYLTVYRIEAACEMLADGNTSVTEVCFSCGFNDLSYFIHIFKKHKGVSPRAYSVKA